MTGPPPPSAWAGEVAALLRGPAAEERAAAFERRTPASYRDQTAPAEAARDIAELDALTAVAPGDGSSGRGARVDPSRLAVRPAESEECTFRIRRYGVKGIELTQLLPVLESFGLVVVESVPHRIGAGVGGEPAAHIDDVGVRTRAPSNPEDRFVPGRHGPRLVAALEAVGRGDIDVGPLNQLVIAAALDWRQVTVLRAYLRYRLQGVRPRTGAALAAPLVTFADLARSLVGLFEARFDPAAPPDREATERAACLAQLDLVATFEDDRILRGYLALIDATLRTNYFQTGPDGRSPSTLVVKIDSRAAPDLPDPRPLVEAFVTGPTVEGIHLRAGLIARGGLRWSERPADFRTEILDLAFAQVKKNAIIVPTGAKGGFVWRPLGPYAAGGDPVAALSTCGPDQIREAYEAFVRALLDVTDNIRAGVNVTPPGVVARDGPDPYLVVAADKGTATLSDVANAISEEHGFWLGDAFASGGSRGYDHKEMGITARGAWVAVRRHFHQLGIDVQVDPLRVVGVGDMSGDVFGNGMLRSEAIRLVAAFDHRHVFLDPEPDPASSFAERRRLAALPRSSWADYDATGLSEGGGVWSRDVKSIPLAPAARRALGVEAPDLTPPQLISAVLSAPVDLLWFGGIGTYVRATDESDSEVGDRANDAVRITSDAVRARVIAEGANLGITQRARIRYSRRGGRINADFVDNAAGVATSDLEVNLKILLALAIEEGRLAADDRDGYLVSSTDAVADFVLNQVDHTVAGLNRAAGNSAAELDAYEALIDGFDRSGRLDRDAESLPTTDDLVVRRSAGAGLIRPELAVLLAYAKSDLGAAIAESPLVADPTLLDVVVGYFPEPIRAAFGDLIPRHRLYPQLVATEVAAPIVDQLGIVWAHELAEETGRGRAEVAAAFWVAAEVIGARALWADLERLSSSLSADAEAALHDLSADAVRRLARSYLVGPVRLPPGTGGSGLGLGAAMARDRAVADEVAAAVRADPQAGAGLAASTDAAVAAGADREAAGRFAVAALRAGVDEAGVISRAGHRPVPDVVVALGLVGRASGIDRLADAVTARLAAGPAPGRLTAWHGRAVLDDLAAWRRGAVIDALGLGGPAPDAVAAWVEVHGGELAAIGPLIDRAVGADADPFAVAEIVLRRLRTVV